MKIRQHSFYLKGFTLVELLIAIAIVTVLAGLSFGGFSYVKRKQMDETARIQIGLLENAIEAYYADNGNYPDAGSTSLFNELYNEGNEGATTVPPVGKIYLAELNPNTNKQKWISSVSGITRIVDPWGSEYVYRIGATAKNPDFDLISLGEDKTIDTEDDIKNF